MVSSEMGELYSLSKRAHLEHCCEVFHKVGKREAFVVGLGQWLLMAFWEGVGQRCCSGFSRPILAIDHESGRGYLKLLTAESCKPVFLNRRKAFV